MTNPLRRAGRSPRMIAPALFLLCVLAVPGAADEQERVLFDNNNPAGVRSGPRNETTFRLTERHVITSVRTYHWNGGRGAAPGWVMIDCDPEGLSYGRWKGVGQGARSGGAPIYWLAKPNLELRPGVYTIRVSSPKTWAHNAASGHAGIVTVRGVPVRKTPPAAESPEPSPPSSEPKPPETTAPEPTPPAPGPGAGTGGGGATSAPRFEVPARIVVTPPKDLMNEAEWPTGDVLWSPAGAFTPPKTTAEPIEVAAPLDFAALDPLAYAASITAAKEGLRVIQGPMTPEQHRTYEEKWAPYYDFPSEAIVAYLNQLNPLLVKFLAARSGFTAASQALARAMHEACAADVAKEPDLLEAALMRVLSYRTTAERYRATMTLLAEAIAALGNPPNPFEERRQARRRMKRAVNDLLPRGPLFWVLVKAEDGCPQPPRLEGENLIGRGRYEEKPGFARLRWEQTSGPGVEHEDSWSRWHVPRLVPYADGNPNPKPGDVGFRARVEVEMGASWRIDLNDPLEPADAFAFTGLWDGYMGGVFQVGTRNWFLGGGTADVYLSFSPRIGFGVRAPRHPVLLRTTSWRGHAGGSVEVIRHVKAQPKSDGERVADQMLWRHGGEEGETWRRGEWRYAGAGVYDLVVWTNAVLNATDVEYQFHYDLRSLTEEQVDEILSEGELADSDLDAMAYDAREALGKGVPFQQAKYEDEKTREAAEGAEATTPGAPTKTPEQIAAEEAQGRALAFQRDAVRYFTKVLERDRAEMRDAKEPDRRRELMLRVLATDANLKAAQDQIAYLETGNWVRTRTAWDGYNFELMQAIGRKEAQEFLRPQRTEASVHKAIELLPPVEREKARAAFKQLLIHHPDVRRDAEELARFHESTCQRVKAHWSEVSENQQYRAWVFDWLETSAQGVKIVAGAVVLGAASAGVSALGGSATAIWATETLLGCAYGGATGYVEGGPAQALQQSLEWAGVLGFVSSEAIKGYAENGSVNDAAKRGVKAFVLVKGIQYAARFVGGFLVGGAASGADDIARLEQELERARGLIQQAEHAEWALAEALSSGASMETVEQLTRQVEQRAATVNASWYAKFLLKGQPGIAASSIGGRIEHILDDVEPEFLDMLRAMGYEVDNIRFQSCRNPSSAGSFGMDADLALAETPGMVIRKNGRAVSLATLHTDAQRAMNIVYAARTGFTAPESFVNMTTSAHREAYARAFLQESIPFEQLTPYDVQRAADVVRTKVSEIELPAFARAIEGARTLEKEMRTKMLPYLERRMLEAHARGDTAMLKRLTAIRNHWMGIYGQVAAIGKPGGPAPQQLWTMVQRLQTSTGGLDVDGIADLLASGWDAMARWEPR